MARVLSIIPGGTGGATTLAKDIAHWMHLGHHRVWVLNLGAEITLEDLANQGTHQVVKKLRATDLVSLIRQHHIQVIHCHLETFWLAAWAGLVTRVPTIRTVHGSLQRQGMLTPATYLRWWVACHILGQRLVAVSDGVGQELQSHFHIELGRRLWIIPNGCWVDAPPVATKGSRPFSFVFMGRLETAKGVQTLLAAFQVLYERDPNVRLLLVGDGPCRWDIPVDLMTLGVVEVTGWLDRLACLREIVRADVLVLPSQSEGTPMSVLEAMTLGIPVIVSQAANESQLVTQGQEGLVVATNSVQELADAMEWCTRNSDSLAAMGEAAKNTAAQWNMRCAKGYQELVERLAGSGMNTKNA